MKHILLLAVIVACGGSATEAEPFGWCCEGFCGLTGADTAYFETCTCDGLVRSSDAGGRGECVDPLTD